MKLLVTYLLLVGLPVIGVLGVLEVGRSLTPSLSVSGHWKVEIGRRAGANSSCADFFDESGPLTLSISQSGPNLSLLFESTRKLKLDGEIESTSLKATRTGSPDDDAELVQLKATFDPKTNPERLIGALSFNRCPTTSGISFIATRQSKPKAEVR
jgi:hypothetical protein